MKYEHIKPRKCKLCKKVLNGHFKLQSHKKYIHKISPPMLVQSVAWVRCSVPNSDGQNGQDHNHYKDGVVGFVIIKSMLYCSEAEVLFVLDSLFTVPGTVMSSTRRISQTLPPQQTTSCPLSAPSSLTSRMMEMLLSSLAWEPAIYDTCVLLCWLPGPLAGESIVTDFLRFKFPL